MLLRCEIVMQVLSQKQYCTNYCSILSSEDRSSLKQRADGAPCATAARATLARPDNNCMAAKARDKKPGPPLAATLGAWPVPSRHARLKLGLRGAMAAGEGKGVCRHGWKQAACEGPLQELGVRVGQPCVNRRINTLCKRSQPETLGGRSSARTSASSAGQSAGFKAEEKNM